MRDPRDAAIGQRRLKRDSRVDALRGVALIMIFIDHVPGNLLGMLTLRNFGFSDAAELFVLLAGFSSMVAYGGSFDREGLTTGLRRIFFRCVRLYIFQAILLLTVLVVVGWWMRTFGVTPSESGAPYVHSGLNGLKHGLTLQALPASLNILPLYIILLALFPLIYGLIRLSPLVALAASFTPWLAVNLDPSLNLTNWLDGNGWFFNPFAWQFLFVLGALGVLVMQQNDGDIPRPVWLRLLCYGYLGFALIAVAPWAGWGLWDAHPIAVETPDKTVLAPLRLLNILAIAILALGSARFRRLAETPALRPLVVCGRNSLEVFSAGTLLAMLCRLTFRTVGITAATQLLANGIGIGMMLVLAYWLEQHRRPAGPQRVRTITNSRGKRLASTPGV
jgi:hypothetical protein